MKLYFKEKYIDIPADTVTDIVNENVANLLIKRGIAEPYNYQDKKKEEVKVTETQDTVTENSETNINKEEKKVNKSKKNK